MACHFLLQGIFPTQGSNPGLPYGRPILYQLSYKGSPLKNMLLMQIIINDFYLSKQEGGWYPEGGRSFTLKRRTSLLLLSCMCVVTQLCPALCDPWTITRQAPLSMEFSRQAYWSWLPFPSPGDLPNPGIKPGFLHCRQTLYHLSHQIIDPLCAYCQPKIGINSYSPIVKIREVLLKFASSSFHPLTDKFASPCKNFYNYLCLSQNNHCEHQADDFKSFSMHSISADTLVSVWNKIMFYNLQYPFPGLCGIPL